MAQEYDVYKEAISSYGEDTQTMMFFEEAGELMTAIVQYERGQIPIEELLEEIIDTHIMVQQLRIIFDPDPDQEFTSDIYTNKINRLSDMLESVDISSTDIITTCIPKSQYISKKLILNYGKDDRIMQFFKETGELMTAISQYKRGRIHIEDLLEEIVNTHIAIQVLRAIFDPDPEQQLSSDIYVDKFERLMDKLHYVDVEY